MLGALQRFEHAGMMFLRRCSNPDVARILLVEAPAILGAAWDELDRRWWLGPTEELLRQAMAEGGLLAADPYLLARALLGSLTALGRAIAADPDIVTRRAAESVPFDLTQGLRPPADA